MHIIMPVISFQSLQRRIDDLKQDKIELKKMLSISQLSQAALERELFDMEAEQEEEEDSSVLSVAIQSLFPVAVAATKKPPRKRPGVMQSSLRESFPPMRSAAGLLSGQLDCSPAKGKEFESE